MTTPLDHNSLAMAAAKIINQQFGDVFTSTEEKRVAIIISKHFATLQKDKERLDWLIANRSHVSKHNDGMFDVWLPSKSYETARGYNAREAIDKAMEPPQ